MKKKLHKLKDFKGGKIHVVDQVELPIQSTRKLTPEGFLKATAAITRVGVQMYSARDFGIDSDEEVGVLRPAETVFHPETIESVKMKPIVLLHPEQDVDSTNVSRLRVGSVGETVEAIDTERLGASIQIEEEAIVKKVLEREVEELSLGYDVFIISKEGVFSDGCKYSYMMDGPMLNNHLAIVPEGRCGDTVKILDTGGSEMTKEQLMKMLRDAGYTDKQIKGFMKKAKDSDQASADDLQEFSKLILKKNQDIDIQALVPAIVAELKPSLEEIVASPEFQGALAVEIAKNLGAAPAGGAAGGEGGDGGGEGGAGDQEGEEETMTKEQMDAKVKDDASARIKLMDKAGPFLKDVKDFDMHKAENRDILEKALEAVGIEPEKMKDHSDEYLMGILDTISADRKKAASFIDGKWKDSMNNVLSAPMNVLKFRQRDRKKK